MFLTFSTDPSLQLIMNDQKSHNKSGKIETATAWTSRLCNKPAVPTCGRFRHAMHIVRIQPALSQITELSAQI